MSDVYVWNLFKYPKWMSPLWMLLKALECSTVLALWSIFKYY